MKMPRWSSLVIMLLGTPLVAGAPQDVPSPAENPWDAISSLFVSEEDGWLDLSEFISQDWGFLPLGIPITEPAVGYGAVLGGAFIDQPEDGGRPDITAIGGLGTDNGTRGYFVGDSRYWMDHRVQTLVGALDASVNLDFHGIGRHRVLNDDPLQYTLEPVGVGAQVKYKLGESDWWAGLAGAYFATDIRFNRDSDPVLLPGFERRSEVAGFVPSITYDTRDNIFTPNRGDYLDFSTGIFHEQGSGNDPFERLQFTAMHYQPLHPSLVLGLRAQASAAFGDTPFYMEPFLLMRGVQAMRYQGEQAAQIEAELRWRVWERISLVAFGGCGAAWNGLERYDDPQTAMAGGFGLRYELARKQGIHAGVDIAFGPDDPAIYLQIGSAWARP